MDKKDLLFAKSHEWIEHEGTTRKVGISDHAQSQLGDIVFVEFPDDGMKVEKGGEVLMIESCKATAAIYSPLAGKITKFNEALIDTPEKLNEDPYGEGWLFEIEVEENQDSSHLMNYEKYESENID